MKSRRLPARDGMILPPGRLSARPRPTLRELLVDRNTALTRYHRGPARFLPAHLPSGPVVEE